MSPELNACPPRMPSPSCCGRGLVTDAAANGYANYVLDPAVGVTPGWIGQSVITALAVGLVALSPWLAPWFIRANRKR